MNIFILISDSIYTYFLRTHLHIDIYMPDIHAIESAGRQGLRTRCVCVHGNAYDRFSVAAL